jgi:hypothetical protein
LLKNRQGFRAHYPEHVEAAAVVVRFLVEKEDLRWCMPA